MVVFIGSALTILAGALMVLFAAIAPLSSPARAAALPPHFGSIAIGEALILLGFGGWGVASGVGLIQTKQWARISMLVYASILVFICVPAALLFAFVRFPATGDPNLPPNFLAMVKVGVILFYGTFAALGGFWLYFFNKQSVKAQFVHGRSVTEPGTPELPMGSQPTTHQGSQRARPLSVSIIAWFMLVASALMPLWLLFFRAYAPGVQIPMCFLGFFVFGSNAFLIIAMWVGLQAAAAVGMLKLKNWGRLTTIGLQCLALLNFALCFGIPANRLRFQQLMDAIAASTEAQMPQPIPVVFPAWMGALVSLPVVFVILWFLIAEKQAFASNEQGLTR